MRNIRNYFMVLAAFTLVFTSCSKEDEMASNNSEKATLSFGAILNDLVTKDAELKQQMDGIPQCSDDAPAYVEVVLTGATNVGTMQNPLVVAVNPNPGDYDSDGTDEYFTEESEDLELIAGTYTLQHFAVYNAHPEMDGQRIWVAPRNDGDLASFVGNPLPMSFNLDAGVKKYVDVDVLCFDDRLVQEYGYLFFDIENTRAIEFCIFGNYCPPSGRHFPAQFSVNVWMYENDTRGEQIYSDFSNNVALNDDGDYAGDPLCIALPDREGEDEYYFEITLRNSDAYDTVEERIIRQGVITDEEVKSFFDGDNNIDYYHFREGCGDDSPPIFSNPEEEAEHYKACLYPKNGTKAFGFAYFKLKGETLETTVLASNFETGKEHPQYLYENSDCGETGEAILALSAEDGSFPVAVGAYGDIIYHRTFTLGVNNDLTVSGIDLENRTVGIHGKTVDGTYQPGVVVSCGELVHQNFDH